MNRNAAAALDQALPEPANLPDLSAPWAQEVLALREEDVVLQACTLWPQMEQARWRFTLLIYRIWKEGWYRPYKSLTAWAVAHDMSSGEVSKHRQEGEFLLTQVPDQADRDRIIEKSTPTTLANAGIHRLARTDPTEAIRLATSGMTSRELVDAVKTRLAEPEHHDVGGYRNLHFTAISLEAHRAFMRAYHRAKFFCQTPRPTDSELLILIAAELGGSLQVQPETALHVGRAVASWRRSQGPLPDAPKEVLIDAGMAAIDGGLVRCVETGATNANDIDFHHSCPRSVPTGVDSPQVPISRAAHDAIKEDFEAGGWRQYVRTWMARTDLVWFRSAFESYLNGRTLEQLR